MRVGPFNSEEGRASAATWSLLLALFAFFIASTTAAAHHHDDQHDATVPCDVCTIVSSVGAGVPPAVGAFEAPSSVATIVHRQVATLTALRCTSVHVAVRAPPSAHA